MREILFRGKRWESECGKPAPAIWLEGSLFYDPVLKRTFILVYDKHAFSPGMGNMGAFHAHAVTPETVGQYTGLTDKNGQKIFEGDVVHMRTSGLSGHGEIVYKDGSFGIEDKKRNRFYYMYHDAVYRVDGNIHDNPELLEGGATDG